MKELKYISTDYSPNKELSDFPSKSNIISTQWSISADDPIVEGYKFRLRNKSYVKPVQETVQAETVYTPKKQSEPAMIVATPERIKELTTSKKVTRGTVISDGINIGNMQHILDKFADAGINIRVTSGQRNAGQAGKSGNKSHHVTGNAIDIVPGKGETFESMREKIKNNPELLQYFRDNKIGIIDETTEDVMKRTGATGAHWHIGPDRLALSGFETMFAKQGGSVPSRIDMLVAKFNEQFNK